MTSAIIGSSISGGKSVPSYVGDDGVKDGVVLMKAGVKVEYEVARRVGSMIALSEVDVGVVIVLSKAGEQLITLTAKKKSDTKNNPRD
jgi:hypothetical protein